MRDVDVQSQVLDTRRALTTRPSIPGSSGSEPRVSDSSISLCTTDRYHAAVLERRAYLLSCVRLLNQVERLDVRRPDDGEVPPVERGDRPDPESLFRSHDRCVDCAVWEVSVLRDELRNSMPVTRLNRFDPEVVANNICSNNASALELSRSDMEYATSGITRTGI